MTNAEPVVSVVIPCDNTAPCLPDCIDSVLTQTYVDLENLLVDNHSTDGSAAIVKEYAERHARIRVVRADRFREQIPNRNDALGLIADASRFVKVVHADDWLHPRCLAECVDLAVLAAPTPHVCTSSWSGRSYSVRRRRCSTERKSSALAGRSTLSTVDRRTEGRPRHRALRPETFAAVMALRGVEAGVANAEAFHVRKLVV